MKYYPIQRALGQDDLLIHTGQHYDYEMSQEFFEKLGIKAPDYHLGAKSSCLKTITGRIMEVLDREKPEKVVVYGDTNSTLAGAFASALLGIPLAHIEAGCRSYSSMIEERNRVITDRLSDFRFCPSARTADNLKKEGLDGVFTGDVMKDMLRLAKREPKKFKFPFILLTVHRAENTNEKTFREILKFTEQFPQKIYFPIHPRTKPLFSIYKNIIPISPLNYISMLEYIEHADMVLTDSGGVQKEAYWLRTPCVTLRNETEWPETLESGWNVLWGDYPNNEMVSANFHPDYYGDGHSAEKIVEILNA